MFRFRVFRVFTASSALTTALLLGSATALTACNYSPPGPAVDQPVGLNVDASRVTLVDPGQGDKQQLAYRDIGNEQELTYSSAESFTQDVVDAADVESYSPEDTGLATTSLKLTGEVEEASDAVEGQQPATRNAFFTVSEPDFSGGTDLSSADGFQFGWRANDDGQMSSLRLAAPQSAADDARAIAEQAIVKLTALPVVFPHDEIGTGGSWTVESRVTGQASLLQTATYTVKEINGDTVVLDVKIEQRPSQGSLSLDGAGQGLDGQSLDVMDSSTESRGEITIDLTKPLPVAGDVQYTTTVVYGTDESEARVVQTSASVLTFK